MPSTRKRIGYLPSIYTQEIITNLAKKEKLSQSKIVGILVEEALAARGVLDIHNPNVLIRGRNSPSKVNQINNSSFKYNDLEELISDKGITYNTKKYKHSSGDFLSDSREPNNEDLFEKFKQFLQFQKMLEEKQ